MSYELKQYSFGQTIGKGFNLYFENCLPIILLSILCQIPIGIYNHYIHLEPLLNQSTFFIYITGFFKTIIDIVFDAILSAFIIHLVSKEILNRGRSENVRPSSSIFRLCLKVITLSFLVGLLTLLGTFLCIIPGILVSLGLSVATAALMIERCGIREAISRSWELTDGRILQIFGLTLVSGLIEAGIGLPFLGISSWLRLNDAMTEYLNLAVSVITDPIQACIMVVVYFNLRIEKEGFNIEHLVQQFSILENQGSSAHMES